MHKKNILAAGRRIFRRVRINNRYIKYNISAKVNVKKSIRTEMGGEIQDSKDGRMVAILISEEF